MVVDETVPELWYRLHRLHMYTHTHTPVDVLFRINRRERVFFSANKNKSDNKQTLFAYTTCVIIQFVYAYRLVYESDTPQTTIFRLPWLRHERFNLFSIEKCLPGTHARPYLYTIIVWIIVIIIVIIVITCVERCFLRTVLYWSPRFAGWVYLLYSSNKKYMVCRGIMHNVVYHARLRAKRIIMLLYYARIRFQLRNITMHEYNNGGFFSPPSAPFISPEHCRIVLQYYLSLIYRRTYDSRTTVIPYVSANRRQ